MPTMINFFDLAETLADVAASSTTTVDTPPATPAGATLIGHIATATTTAHTGPAGDTWELLGTSAQGQLLTSVWRRIATGTEDASYTWGHGNTRAAGRIAAYTGVLDVAAIEPAGTTTAGDTIATTAVAVPAGGWLLLLAACRRGSPSVPQVWTSADPLDAKRGEVSGATGASNQVSSALLDSDRPLAADPAAVRTVNAAETWAQTVVWAIALTPVPTPPPPDPVAPPDRAGSRWSTPLTTGPLVPLLDLTAGIGQRTAGYRFDLLDARSGRVLGPLHPLRDPPPQLDHDTTRTITRTLSMQLGQTETARVDPVRHRVRPVMLIPGAGEWPLGEYLWSAMTDVVESGGNWADTQLVDQMLIVDQELQVGFTTRATGVDVGTTEDEEELLLTAVEPVPAALARLLADVPIRHRITPSPGFSLGSWPAGQGRAQVVEALAVDGGYSSPWFDHAGVLRFVPAAPSPQLVVPTVDWDQGNTIIAGTITLSTTLLDAPNRYIVVSNGVGGGEGGSPVVGIADVPVNAPHSIPNRGFVLARVVERQVASVAQAQLVARTLAARDALVQVAELDTAADPRHDGHDVVRWRGVLWREEAWSLPLTAAGVMHHRLRRLHT